MKPARIPFSWLLSMFVVALSCGEPPIPENLRVVVTTAEIVINGDTVFSNMDVFREESFSSRDSRDYGRRFEANVHYQSDLTGVEAVDIPVFLEISDDVSFLLFTRVAESACAGVPRQVSLLLRERPVGPFDTLSLMSSRETKYKETVQDLPFREFKLYDGYAVRHGLSLEPGWVSLEPSDGSSRFASLSIAGDEGLENFSRIFGGLVTSLDELSYQDEWHLTIGSSEKASFGQLKKVLSRIAGTTKKKGFETRVNFRAYEPWSDVESRIEVLPESGSTLLDLNLILDVAVVNSQLSCVRACLSKGADPNFESNFTEIPKTETVLMVAVRRGDPSVIAALLEGGADVAKTVRIPVRSARDHLGYPLKHITRSVFDCALENPEPEVWKVLLNSNPPRSLVTAALEDRAVPGKIESLIAGHFSE